MRRSVEGTRAGNVKRDFYPEKGIRERWEDGEERVCADSLQWPLFLSFLSPFFPSPPSPFHPLIVIFPLVVAGFVDLFGDE